MDNDATPPELPDAPDAPGVTRFFKKRAVIVSAVVVAVLAVTIVTDLPENASVASQIATDKAVIQAVNADVGPCAYAANESFMIYADQKAHTLTQSDACEGARAAHRRPDGMFVHERIDLRTDVGHRCAGRRFG